MILKPIMDKPSQSAQPTPVFLPEIDFTHDLRVQALCTWLRQHPTLNTDTQTLSVVTADASFRRYFRIHDNQNKTYILMDSPPEHGSIEQFIKVNQLFNKSGLHVPTIYEFSIADGFMILSDFGNQTYAKALNAESADDLYSKATDSLILLQKASTPGLVPDYSEAILLREMRLFHEWYLPYKQIDVTAEIIQRLEMLYKHIASTILTQPVVLVHRDYHCRNLMVTPQQTPGILDFQDALFGPITYDIVSLWRDAYMPWPEERQIDWVIRYWEKARAASLPVSPDFGEFYRQFEWMGLQRHLKILGIFARLSVRDNKHQYLDDLPLVEAYVFHVLQRYSELSGLRQAFEQWQLIPTTSAFTF